MSDYAKIGIFGGTFNPIHNAHIKIAEHFFNQMNLDVVFFVPANISPFKTEEKSILISSDERIKMISLAIAENPDLQIDPYEIEQGGISFTINTIEHFKKKYPDSELFLIIGDDQKTDFKKWKDWQKILTISTLCIAGRLGNLVNEQRDKFENELDLKGSKIFWLNNEIIDISSSRIRKMINQGESPQPFIPDKVLEYILSENLYQKSN